LRAVEEFEWIGHHKLLRTIIVSGRMVNEEPLRVGAGPGKAALGPTDLVVLKVLRADGEELPVVPGSSFKGMLRATCTSVLRALGFRVCDGLPKSVCLEGNEFYDIERRGLSADEEVREKIRRIVEAGIEKGKRSICPLCLLFGAPSLASHVEFMDSYPTGDFKLGYRTCVAIDRRKGSSARGALFTVEYVEPGCEWSFEFKAENTPNYLLGLLLEAIELVNVGLVKVGGMKSRGFGKVRIELNKVIVFSTNHERYGIKDGKLQRLDPIDESVDWPGTLEGYMAKAEEEAAKVVIEGLRAVWHKSITKLRKCYRDGRWVWKEALEDASA